MTSTTINIAGHEFLIKDENSEAFLQEVAGEVGKLYEKYIDQLGEYDEEIAAMALAAYELAYVCKMQKEEINRLSKLANPSTRTTATPKRSYNGSKRTTKAEDAKSVTLVPATTEDTNS